MPYGESRQKNPGTGGETVVAALERARTVYAGLASEDADAGYAVDEINGLLARYAAVPRFELTEEEEAEGFEVLFDGLSLEKWTGNKTNYVPQEGTIYVTAQYGGSGNLYTVREYGDFILRFEFSFVRPGVNNGIGIRTPMGVDAAYHGMEIQVLDHDDPIYKNLHVYQQHGSVYGVIPAQKARRLRRTGNMEYRGDPCRRRPHHRNGQWRGDPRRQHPRSLPGS